MLEKLPIIGKKLAADHHMKEVVNGAAIAFILRIIGAAAQFAFNILLARMFGAEGMGVYILAFTISTIASVIGRVGMDQTMLKLISIHADRKEWAELKGVFLMGIGLSSLASVCIMILLYILAPWLSVTIFHQSNLILPIQLMALSILPFSMLNLIGESLRALKLIKYSSLVQGVLVPVLNITLLTVFYIMHFNLTGAVISYIIATVITALIGLIIWIKVLPVIWESRIKPVFMQTKEISKMASPMMGIAILTTLFGLTDTLILGMFASLADVGIYTAALRMAMLISFILIAVNSISAPKFAALYRNGDIKTLERVAQHSTKLMTMIAIPLLFIFIFFANPIMKLYGEEFVSGAVILIILAIGQIINVMTGSVGFLLLMTNYQYVLYNLLILTVIFNIFCSYIVIPILGILGAAIINSVSVIMLNILALYFVKTKLKIIINPFK